MAQNRINKINEQLMREISAILRELKDTRIPLMTSVVHVNATGDLRYAKVRVSIMGDEQVKQNAMKALRSAAGFVRREVGHRMDIRYTPELIFELDNSIEHGANINKLLHEVIDEDGKHEGKQSLISCGQSRRLQSCRTSTQTRTRWGLVTL